MISADQVHISGGTFIQNINHRDRNILNSLPRSRDAAFSAAINLNNLSRRSCTKGTRVDIIEQIMAWVNEKDPAKSPPVYWLTGLAGLGKTTIAYTICELLNDACLPFASFFCSLQLDSRNSKLLVTTLCRDLAELYTSYAANVLSILETNSKVVDSGLRIQIGELLAKPWQASIAQRNNCDIPTPIVVVDALDESDRGTEFLEELLRVIHAGQLVGIKFLVTSRLEPKIVNICKSFPPNAVCRLHEVDTANVQNDIEKYLREAFPELEDEPELALLSQRAGGFFIYATTAVRFISPPYNPPSASEMRSHLQVMLNPDPLTPHADDDDQFLVDELYERILGDAFRDARVRATRLQILHTIVCAESSIDMSVLADLTNTDQDTAKKVVESLHAVLYVSSTDGCVYWYHASFPDFVFSRARARIFPSPNRNYPTRHVVDVFCDAPAHHEVLARRCFSVMQESLHFNMCNLPSSYTFDSEVFELGASFSPTLRYVSRHWARHLLRVVPPQNDTDDLFCNLKDFLCNKLLFWIEAMNLIDAKHECSSLLKDAESWLKTGKEWPDLEGQLADATNFSAFFAGSPASKSTPHLYISALSTWNQDSPIWKNWRDRFRFIPSISLPKCAVTIPLVTIPTPNRVLCIAISPDGNQIVSASWHTLWVWDAKNGEQLMELQGHTDWITSVAISPTGNQIISASEDNSVRVWDAKTGEQLKELEHPEEVTSVAISPDGHQIVSGSHGGLVRVWDAKTGVQLRELQGHTHPVTSLAISHDGNQIVSGCRDRLVQVWDAKTGEQLRKLLGHTGVITSLAISHDGNQIVSGSHDKSVRVWDAKTTEQLMVLQGHTDWVTSVAFSPDGNRIGSASEDKTMRVWDAKTGEQLREHRGHTDVVTSVTFSPDGHRIISGSRDTSVQVCDAKTVEQLRELQGHSAKVASVAFTPDGNQIISGSWDHSVRAWDAKTGELLRELQGHTDWVNSAAISPDGNRIVSGSVDESVRVWNTNTGEQMRVLKGYTGKVTSVAFSSDGNKIISADNRTVRLWDSETGQQLQMLQGYTSSVTLSPDGNQIIFADDKSVLVADAKTGEQVGQLQGHTRDVTSIAISPDGNQIFSADDKSVLVWDAKTGEHLRKLRGRTIYVITSIAISPDGTRIVIADGLFVRVWDAKTGEQLRKLQGHTRLVVSVAFSPDGERIVSGSTDQSVRVWGDLNLDTSWVMHEDGWIISAGERLVWVPLTIRNVLLRPHNIFIISRTGSATISFDQCKLGTLWHECYTP